MPKPLFSNHKAMRDIPTTAAVPCVCPLLYVCGCQDWRVHAVTHSANRLDLGGCQYTLECRSYYICLWRGKVNPICFFARMFVANECKQVQGITPKCTHAPW